MGTEVWNSLTRLAPTPRDQPSIFAASDWIAPHRITVQNNKILPGKTGKFSFTLKAPKQPGTYTQTFSVVQEAVTWFADSYGPDDTKFKFTVKVTKAVPGTGGTSSGGAAGSSSQGGTFTGAAGLEGEAGTGISPGGQASRKVSEGEGSCECTTTPDETRPPAFSC